VPGVNVPAPPSSTVNLDLGNLAEVNLVAINPSHITHVRLTGTRRQASRKMEIHLVSGSTVGMNFDEETEADDMFAAIVGAMHQTVVTDASDRGDDVIDPPDTDDIDRRGQATDGPP
jgi:hypothetical protein